MIHERDLNTLDGSRWLNDQVINSYLAKIVQRSEEPGRLAVYAFHSQFYSKLLQYGYDGVKQWTKDVDIFKKRFLFIPVHLGVHWCLTVVDVELKRIDYYDSMHKNNWPCLVEIRNYILEESVEKRGIEYDMEEWPCASIKDIPMQTNTYDCGVFLCVFAEHISREVALDFGGSGKEIAIYRRRIKHELSRDQLLKEGEKFE